MNILICYLDDRLEQRQVAERRLQGSCRPLTRCGSCESFVYPGDAAIRFRIAGTVSEFEQALDCDCSEGCKEVYLICHQTEDRDEAIAAFQPDAEQGGVLYTCQYHAWEGNRGFEELKILLDLFKCDDPKPCEAIRKRGSSFARVR